MTQQNIDKLIKDINKVDNKQLQNFVETKIKQYKFSKEDDVFLLVPVQDPYNDCTYYAECFSYKNGALIVENPLPKNELGGNTKIKIQLKDLCDIDLIYLALQMEQED